MGRRKISMGGGMGKGAWSVVAGFLRYPNVDRDRGKAGF